MTHTTKPYNKFQQLLIDNGLHTKRILLIDGLGALISALTLLFIQLTFESSFGLPVPTLRLLTACALLFSFYSLTCYIVRLPHWKRFLFAVFVCNILYCVLTLLALINYQKQVTYAALLYFSLELTILLFLVRAEWFAIRFQHSNQL